MAGLGAGGAGSPESGGAGGRSRFASPPAKLLDEIEEWSMF